MAQVLTKEPDLKRAPSQVRRLLGRCLEKDPKRRLRDVGDVADLLEDRPLTVAAPKPAKATPWVVAGAVPVLAAVMAWAPWRTGRSVAEDVVRFTMETTPAEMPGRRKFLLPAELSVGGSFAGW